MANLIQIKRGAAAGIPALSAGEMAFTTDTFRLYAGSAGGNKLIGEADFLKLSGGTLTGALTLNADPSSNLHAATKQYVDGLIQGVEAKASVKAATTGSNITLSGTQTIDAIALAATDRCLVKNQTAPAENGIYVVAAGAWARASDADSWAELVSMFVWVEGGTANGDSGWLCTVDAGGTLGTTPVSFVQFSGAGQITAGAGMTKTGNTLDVVGTANRITANADSIDIASTYVGQSSITTLGTVATGTWSATEIAANKGGTGQTGYAIGDLLYASGAAALSKLADVAAGSFLRSGGVGAAPAWSTLVLPNAATAGDIPYASGANTYANLAKGTAYQSLNMNSGATAPAWMASLQSLMTTIGDIVQASGANTPARLAAVATGNALISGGVGTVSSWGKIGLTTHISGTLGAANGGTGVANNAANTITFTGAYALGLTLTGATAVTLPTSGTLCQTIGTPSTTFQIDSGNSGPKLKNITGTQLAIRNAADNGNVDVACGGIMSSGSIAVAATKMFYMRNNADTYDGIFSFPTATGTRVWTMPDETGIVVTSVSNIDGGTW